MKFKHLLIIFSTILFLYACDKYHAKKLSGTYKCRVHYNYWDLTPIYKDSFYYEDIKVARNGKYVVVLTYSIHIDSLWNENEYYRGNVHNHIKILFKNNCVYITRSNGGLGGNALMEYIGTKK